MPIVSKTEDEKEKKRTEELEKQASRITESRKKELEEQTLKITESVDSLMYAAVEPVRQSIKRSRKISQQLHSEDQEKKAKENLALKKAAKLSVFCFAASGLVFYLVDNSLGIFLAVLSSSIPSIVRALRK